MISALSLLLALHTPPPPSLLTLPDGPAAKVWASVSPSTLPSTPEEPSPDWNQVSTWTRWGEILQLEAAATHPDPARRAALCLLARSQGRADDAWRHYVALGRAADDAAPWIAAITPLLLPGVPDGTPIEAGGRPAPLPDGVILTPFLPPTSGRGPSGAVEWRSATVHHLRVGGAVIDLTVTVEATGVEVDITHVDGGKAHLAVLLPEPEGFEIRVEYLDWMRREDADLRTPIPVEVRPGEEPHQLYGRVIELHADLPTGTATRLPEGTHLAGIVFEVDPEDPYRSGLERIAGVLSELLGVATHVRSSGRRPEMWSPTVFRLPRGPGRAARLRYLTSSIETYLLGRDGN